MGSPGNREGKSGHEVKAREEDCVGDERQVIDDCFLEGKPLSAALQTHILSRREMLLP